MFILSPPKLLMSDFTSIHSFVQSSLNVSFKHLEAEDPFTVS